MIEFSNVSTEYKQIQPVFLPALNIEDDASFSNSIQHLLKSFPLSSSGNDL